MKTLWKILAALSVLCGIVSVLIGWAALIKKTTIWIQTEFWFYDAITAGVFAIFFLILYMVYAFHGKQIEGK